MQAIDLGDQLGILLGHAVRDVRRGEGGLLFNGQQDAVLPIHLGEGLVAVVRDFHAGHIHQPHFIHGFQTDGEQLELLELIQRGELVAHAHQIFIAGDVVHIAGRHRDVLRADQPRHRLHGDDAVKSCVLQRLVPLILKLLARFGQLRRRRIELRFRIRKARQRLIAPGFQLVAGIGKIGVLVDSLNDAARNDALIQLLQHRVDLSNSLFQPGLALQRRGVLRVQLILVQRQLQRLVFV